MKSILKSGLLFLAVFLFSNFSAQSKTENLRVEGNCGMCKENIETAAKVDKHVESAKWDKKTKMLTVTYNAGLTSTKNILQHIAKVGYDNLTFRASDKSYRNLETCCQYKRPNNSSKMHANCDPNQVCELK